MKKVKTVILGASGYTGAELLRLLALHDGVEIVALTGDSQAGKKIGDVYPHLSERYSQTLVKTDAVDYKNVDLVFCCLPHGTTQEIIAKLPAHVRIVDLSADFRLHDLSAYEEWYGHAHRAPDLQKQAVYGLTEFYRADIKKARLVANPGCYPTCSLLPVLPLLEADLIEPQSIGIDALSGVSGAGRAAKQEMLFCEVGEGVSAYGVGKHRHMGEIDQEISQRAGTKITASFTPHLVPISRGMLATIHAGMKKAVTSDKVREVLKARYKDEYFVHVLDSGSPATQHVRGSNFCRMSVHTGRIPGELIIVSVIDNLVKGASGQAIQNMNVMFGFEESQAIAGQAVFP